MKVQSIILQLIRGEKIPELELSPVEWMELFNEATHQAVLPLIFDAIKDYESRIPKEIYSKISSTVLKIYALNLKLNIQQSELDRLLSDNGFDYFIMKGTASSIYWPNPELRQLGDCDFLIKKEYKDKIENLLKEDGYEIINSNHPSQVVFVKGGKFEMHFDISGLPNDEKGQKFLECINATFENSSKQAISGCEFMAPNPLYHGLILVQHMQKHMLGEGLGLRHLLDWGYFVTATIDEVFWETDLLPILKEIGLYYYTQIVTKTCAKYCGTACPEWATEADDSICDAVMNDIMTGGNFGRKNSARSAGSMMISKPGKNDGNHGRIINLFHTLHKSTPMVYPFTKKIRVLIPIMDFWRIIKYIGKEISGKRPSVIKISSYVDERKTLYDKLKLFEVE